MKTWWGLSLQNKAKHLYVNIPFCKTLCHFCNFYKNPLRKVDDFFPSQSLSSYYIKELALKKEALQEKILDSIYIGGGSPLDLNPKQFIPLLEHLSDFKVDEYTIESNPDFSPYHDYYQFFNRISIGVQSFQPNLLQTLGRKYEISMEFLKEISTRFDKVSYDLVYDVPSQSVQAFEKDLEIVVNLKPKHISCYLLEENDLLKKKRLSFEAKHSSPTPKALQNILIKTLSQNGYEMYELSNYSLPSYASIHNQAYWSEKDYVGIGPGACGRLSYHDGRVVRYQNHRNLKLYVQSLDENTLPIEWRETLSKTSLMNEYILTKIRKPSGLNLKDFNELYSKDIRNDRLRFFKKYSSFIIDSQDAISLTREGFLYSNEIASELFYDET